LGNCGEFAVGDRTTSRATVAQNDEIRVGRFGSGRLLQSGLEGTLNIGAPAQAARPHEFNGVLNAAGIRGTERQGMRLSIEEDEAKVIAWTESPQQRF
jgi:hypothetical protein